MRPYRTAGFLGFLVLANSACLAQSETTVAPARQRQPSAAAPATETGAPRDLEATRKRFDVNSAKTADRDRKRDAKLKQSLGSICAGCGAAAPAKRARAARPASESPDDEASPSN